MAMASGDLRIGVSQICLLDCNYMAGGGNEGKELEMGMRLRNRKFEDEWIL